MESYEYPIEHFRMMSQLSVRLKPMSILIIEHSYTYESFGSWWFTFKQGGKKFRIVFDGRDYYLSLEQAIVDNSKLDWQSLKEKRLSSLDFDRLVLEVCSLIRE